MKCQKRGCKIMTLGKCGGVKKMYIGNVTNSGKQLCVWEMAREIRREKAVMKKELDVPLALKDSITETKM